MGLIGGILCTEGHNSTQRNGSFGISCKCNEFEVVQQEKCELKKMSQKMSEYISKLEKEIEAKHEYIKQADAKFIEMERNLKDKLFNLKEEKDEFENMVEKLQQIKQSEDVSNIKQRDSIEFEQDLNEQAKTLIRPSRLSNGKLAALISGIKQKDKDTIEIQNLKNEN